MGWYSLIKRPISNGNTLWTTYDYTNIDEAIEDPTVGDGLIVSANDGDDGEEQIWNLGLISAADTLHLWSIDQVVIKAYAQHILLGGDMDVRLNIGGVWTAKQDLGEGVGYTWLTLNFDGSWNTANFMTTFQVGVTANCGQFDSVSIDTLYAIIKGYTGG